MHFCTAPLSELTELKHAPGLWKCALTAQLSPSQTTLKQTLVAPITATALMIRLDSFHLNLQVPYPTVLLPALDLSRLFPTLCLFSGPSHELLAQAVHELSVSCWTSPHPP